MWIQLSFLNASNTTCTACGEGSEVLFVAPNVGDKQGMTWNEMVNLKVIAYEERTILTVSDIVFMMSMVLHRHGAVGEIADGYGVANLHIVRSELTRDSVKPGVVDSICLRQGFPMVEAQILGNDVEGGGVRSTLVVGESQ